MIFMKQDLNKLRADAPYYHNYSAASPPLNTQYPNAARNTICYHPTGDARYKVVTQ